MIHQSHLLPLHPELPTDSSVDVVVFIVIVVVVFVVIVIVVIIVVVVDFIYCALAASSWEAQRWNSLEPPW